MNLFMLLEFSTNYELTARLSVYYIQFPAAWFP